MALQGAFSAQEAELNFICAPLSPLNYSSRDGAPETTALGNKGTCLHRSTANISLFHMRAARMHFMRKVRAISGFIPDAGDA